MSINGNLQGTYTDITEIGAGGGGTVFKAFHVRMQKYVVLKKIHDNLMDNVDIRGELDILKNLRHEYLPTVLDFIEDEGAVYTVMDYIPGESFESLLQKGVRFTQAQTVKYAAQLGQVLSYLHGQRMPIVHGDIKPANLMLTPEDNICLIDFNISQFQDGVVSRNMGYTPGYASPEQTRIVQALQWVYAEPTGGGSTVLLGAEPTGGGSTVLLGAEPAGGGSTVLLGAEPTGGGSTVLLGAEPTGGGSTVLLGAEPAGGGSTVLLDAAETTLHKAAETGRKASLLPSEQLDVRSDIYSAGATLYAIVCGRTPEEDFSGITPIERLVPDCSEGLAHLIGKCMEIRPEKRFQTAEEFVRAVAGIARVDKRYRRLVARQTLAAVGCIIGIAGCSILAILGKEQIGTEAVAAYNVLVGEIEELRGDGEAAEAQIEEIYREAVAAFPDEADAYYQKAAYLYENRNYEELVKFIEQEALPHGAYFSDEETADFYFLMANGYLELNDLDSALTYYRTAVKYNAFESVYCSDYAIALARAGELEEAERVLESAEERGLSDDRLLLARGEIAAKRGNLTEAADFFARCAGETGDSYILLRAYVLWGKMYDDPSDEAGLMEKVSVLAEGVQAVADGDRAVVLEQLAQGCIDLGELTEDHTWYRKAIECLQKVAGMGWDTFVTHNNIGILYETVGEYELAEKEFSDMLAVFGEDYRIYKRLAFLEIEIQAARENADRDYGRFVDYYDMAKQLFMETGARADSDMELQLLEQAYVQLEEGNWLKWEND